MTAPAKGGWGSAYFAKPNAAPTPGGIPAYEAWANSGTSTGGGWGSAYTAKPVQGAVPAASGTSTGGGWGSAYTARPQPLQKSGGGGLFGFVKNLGSDAEHAITGLPAGIEQVASAAAHDFNKATASIPVVGHALAKPLIGKSAGSQGGYELPGVAKAVGQQYSEEYSPLVHGDLGQFGSRLYQHPLGPILDAATVATLGAGGVAKAGAILSKVGAISDTSRLATLGNAVDLTVPDFAKQVGQDGESIIVKRSATNPLIRARQVATNNVLNRLPESTPVVGSSARIVKAISRQPERTGYGLTLDAQPFRQAFAKLNGDERAAFHLTARGVTPDEYKGLLGEQANASPGMLKVLDNPKVAELAANPSKNLADALDKGEQLSGRLTALKVAAGHISEDAAAQAPYRTLRLVNGAKFAGPGASATLNGSDDALRAELAGIEGDWSRLVGQAMPAKPGDYRGVTAIQNAYAPKLARKGVTQSTVTGQLRDAAEQSILKTMQARPNDPAVQAWTAKLARADAIRGELTRRADAAIGLDEPGEEAYHSGLVDQPGRDIVTLAKELEAQGRRQPFYVHDTAETTKKNPLGSFRSKPTGFAAPAASGAAKRNLGILASKGLLAFGEDPLTPEYMRFARWAEANALHDELVKHAAALPRDVARPPGYEYLKINRGEASAPYTQRVGGDFEQGLADEHGLEPGTADRFLTQNNTDRDILTNANGERLVVPASVRKILENRTLTYHGALHKLLYGLPTNVWKHLVLGLRPGFFTNITVGNSILGTLQAAPGRFGLLGWLNQVVPGAEKLFGSKLTAQTMRDVLPEQAAGTFGHSVGMSQFKGVNLAHKAAQGVMPATVAYENVLRRAMAEGWAKATPEVQAAMRANGGDVNAALREIAHTHPQVVNDISKRIDDALGNYRSYSKFERAIKQVVPFYGWDRHIVRSAARLALERPGRLSALRAIGTQGNAVQNETLGPLPSYMQGDIRLPGLPSFMGPLNGRTPVMQTSSLNPFHTLVDLGGIPGALFRKSGTGGDTLSNVNPILQAVLEQLTGRSLLTGQAIKGNAFAYEANNIPQVSTLETLFGHGAPTKPTSLYQYDNAERLASLFGIPIKKVALNTAHLDAAKGY